MINIFNNLYIPKNSFEMYENDYNILGYCKNLKKDQCIIWIVCNINTMYYDNNLPDIIYHVYSDIEINESSLKINNDINKSLSILTDYLSKIKNDSNFFTSSYITYIENGDKNKEYFLEIFSNFNIPVKYINNNEYIHLNNEYNDNIWNSFLNLQKTCIKKNNTFSDIFQYLKNYIIYGNDVYEYNKKSNSNYTFFTNIYKFKSIIADTYSLSYRIINILLKNLNTNINIFIYEFPDFYIDIVNKLVYLKNDKYENYFKENKIKTCFETKIINIKQFDFFELKNINNNELISKYINEILKIIYLNNQLIITGDEDIYNYIKKILSNIYTSKLIIFIETDDLLFYEKNNNKLITILYNKKTDIFDINLKIENFKKEKITKNKIQSIILNCLFKN